MTQLVCPLVEDFCIVTMAPHLSSQAVSLNVLPVRLSVALYSSVYFSCQNVGKYFVIIGLLSNTYMCLTECQCSLPSFLNYVCRPAWQPKSFQWCRYQTRGEGGWWELLHHRQVRGWEKRHEGPPWNKVSKISPFFFYHITFILLLSVHEISWYIILQWFRIIYVRT